MIFFLTPYSAFFYVVASSYCPNAQCVNYDGAYQCLCNNGFQRVGLTTCNDINECAFDGKCFY